MHQSRFTTTTKPISNGSYYNFSNVSQPTNTVRVDNIAQHANRREIVALFNTLVGEVRDYKERMGTTGLYLEVTFHHREAASLIYDWVHSCRLITLHIRLYGDHSHVNDLVINPEKHRVVTTMNAPPTTICNKEQSDDRRNLYVLGLPFGLTKNEFAQVFSRYGTVSHCVILATVDNSSRRRGFVVMSTNEEAKQAMTSLTRTQLKGHIIDVSWAVVQRSQGFLDGGDRGMLLDSRSSQVSPSPSTYPSPFHSSDSDSSIESNDVALSTVAVSTVPTSALLVTNLPKLLFSQNQDLHPLFYPFGQIKKLEIVETTSSSTLSVIVQYASSTVAEEARETLHGQRYATHQVDVQYIQPVSSTVNITAPILAQNSFETAFGYRSQTPSYDAKGLRRFNHSHFDSQAGPKNNPFATHLSSRFDRNDSNSGFANSRWNDNFILGSSLGTVNLNNGYRNLAA